jgi:hypothetical protein
MTSFDQNKKFSQDLEWYEDQLKNLAPDHKIPFLKNELSVTHDQSKKKVILLLLHLSSLKSLNFETALWALNEEIKLDPEATLPLVSKAELFLYHMDRVTEAKNTIEIGIRSSNQTGHFRRHALAVKARIALALDDYGLLEQTLNSIVETRVEPGSQDVGREGDFFLAADKSRLSHDCIKRYENYLARKN